METQLRSITAAMAAPAPSLSSHYITFRLGDELFAIDVSQVREVLDLSVITRLPTAPEYLRGVVNVRGSATTVVDLRLKFGLPRIPDTANTRIIVLEVTLDGEPCVIGGLADSVHEVVEFEASQIAPPPSIGMRWRADLIQGVTRRGDQFIIIFDIEKVFATDGDALRAALEPEAPAEAEAAPAAVAEEAPVEPPAEGVAPPPIEADG